MAGRAICEGIAHAAAFAVVVLIAAVAPVSTHAASPMTVLMDQATVMPVERPAATIIIGNPAIADATILDSQTLVITGHSYGTTNLLVLDATGQRIANQLVTVVPPESGSVTVHRRSAKQTYSCAPACSPAIALGDSKEDFNAIDAQVRSRRGLSDDAGGQPKN